MIKEESGWAERRKSHVKEMEFLCDYTPSSDHLKIISSFHLLRLKSLELLLTHIFSPLSNIHTYSQHEVLLSVTDLWNMISSFHVN